MIYDRLEHLTDYLADDLKAPVAAFLEKAATLPVGRYDVAGEKAYAMVHAYATHAPETCNVEAHDKYIDIQATLEGAEGITVYDRKALKTHIPYDETKDVAFYKQDGEARLAHTVNRKGYFTMLQSDEAHRPQECAGGFDKVKKFVIKVRVNQA